MTTSAIPWPTTTMLERVGFVRCAEPGCAAYLEPANWPSKTCKRHQQKPQSRSRVAYIPRARRAA